MAELELYDLLEDPRALRDVAAQRPEVVEELLGSLQTRLPAPADRRP